MRRNGKEHEKTQQTNLLPFAKADFNSMVLSWLLTNLGANTYGLWPMHLG